MHDAKEPAESVQLDDINIGTICSTPFHKLIMSESTHFPLLELNPVMV